MESQRGHLSCSCSGKWGFKGWNNAGSCILLFLKRFHFGSTLWKDLTRSEGKVERRQKGGVFVERARGVGLCGSTEATKMVINEAEETKFCVQKRTKSRKLLCV